MTFSCAVVLGKHIIIQNQDNTQADNFRLQKYPLKWFSKLSEVNRTLKSSRFKKRIFPRCTIQNKLFFINFGLSIALIPSRNHFYIHPLIMPNSRDKWKLRETGSFLIHDMMYLTKNYVKTSLYFYHGLTRLLII